MAVKCNRVCLRARPCVNTLVSVRSCIVFLSVRTCGDIGTLHHQQLRLYHLKEVSPVNMSWRGQVYVEKHNKQDPFGHAQEAGDSL